MATVTARGASGTVYHFNQYLMTGQWLDVPAIYMFAYLGVGGWKVLYIGQCSSAKTRLPCHERWAEAIRKGATHVLSYGAPQNEADRLRIERDLIQCHQPAMNEHHVGMTLLTGALRA